MNMKLTPEQIERANSLLERMFGGGILPKRIEELAALLQYESNRIEEGIDEVSTVSPA